MTLVIEAVIREGSELVNKSVREITSKYGIFIVSSHRVTGSDIERVNPNPERTLKVGDRLEFKGEEINVLNLFKKCECPL